MNDLLTQKNLEPTVERAYCKVCGAVYFARAWRWSKVKRDDFEKNGMPAVLCSACYKIRNDLPSGILSFIGVKDKMKMSLMLREVEKITKDTQEKEPLSRVIRINEKSDETVVYTTEANLAKKIGRHLTRAFSGTLSIDDTGDNLTRVVWISKES